MGLMDMFSKTVVCPECRKKGAKQVLVKVRCSNASCKNFDSQYILELATGPSSSPRKRAQELKGDFNPAENTISIEYRNFLGEDRSYQGDKSTLNSNGEHVSLRVVPTGRRITLRRRFIRNLDQVDKCIDELSVMDLNKQKDEIPVTIKYRNYKNEDLSIVGDANTMSYDGCSIKIKAGSPQKTFYLIKGRIQNFSDLEKYIKK